MPEPDLERAVEAALAKKARGLVVLDLRGLSDVTDYFIICHGTSTRQVQGISNSIEEALRETKRRPKHIEGYTRGEWVLMDYIDIVVHVFVEERRLYYALEKLWSDAPRLLEDDPSEGEESPRKSFSGRGARNV
jgi:ribosome-associated protein